MTVFNGKSLLTHTRPIVSVLTDSSSEAGGAFCEGDWLYCHYRHDWPEVTDMHINSKETLTVVLAALRWAPRWANQLVYVTSDNKTTVAAINKGTCKSKMVMNAIRLLFWLSAIFNFKLMATYVPTGRHLLADCISRLHLSRFWSQLHMFVPVDSYLNHMSLTSFLKFGCRGSSRTARIS